MKKALIIAENICKGAGSAFTPVPSRKRAAAGCRKIKITEGKV